MLLENRNAVIYGGAGAVGSAVARAFAREGARVHLAGRTLATLDAVADSIRAERRTGRDRAGRRAGRGRRGCVHHATLSAVPAAWTFRSI